MFIVNARRKPGRPPKKWSVSFPLGSEISECESFTDYPSHQTKRVTRGWGILTVFRIIPDFTLAAPFYHECAHPLTWYENNVGVAFAVA